MLLLLSAAVTGAVTGPYAPIHQSFTYSALDITNRGVDVIYPGGSTAGGEAFPVVSFAHGMNDGGTNLMARYGQPGQLFEEIASYGYIVVAPRSCNDGCLGDCKNHPFDPPCFADFYEQQLKAIDWTRSSAASTLPVNSSAGVAVAGHSMGGQASLYSAANNASTYGIKAAVLMHAFTHTYPAISAVPHLIFTGTDDNTAPPRMAESIFNANGACATRALVNKIGASHSEPDSYAYNPKLALFTVAWLKVFLSETPSWRGTDFETMLFGNGTDSLCGGGDGAMKECRVLRG